MSDPRVEDGAVYWDGVRLPVISLTPVYTTSPRRSDLNRWGFMAGLATENGAEVSITYDPTNESRFPHQQVSMWLYVRHAGRLIAGRLQDGVIVYDPACRGDSCPGCVHYHGAWFEYVTSAGEVMGHLANLGSLAVRPQTRLTWGFRTGFDTDR